MRPYAMVVVLAAGLASAQDKAPLVLLDVTAEPGARLQPSSAEVSVTRSAEPAGLLVKFAAGKDAWPGVNIKPPTGAAYDLSAYGHVEAKVVNTGDKQVMVALRLDNAGDWRDNPYSTEQIWLKPGERATIKTIFGHSYGHKPSFALKPNAITNILMFSMKAAGEQSWRLESLVAAGPPGETPPVDPRSLRTKPKDGYLFGGGVTLDAAGQVDVKGGVQAALDGAALKATFPQAKGDPAVTLKPAVGRWDLRAATEVRVRLRNVGASALTPTVQVLSDPGPTDLITGAALAPGATGEVVVPFVPAVPWRGEPAKDKKNPGNLPNTGTRFISDAASGVKVGASFEGQAALVVEAVSAGVTPAKLPAWLGQRPPVEGEWVQTLKEEFDGPKLDERTWSIYGPNYWDKPSHWSKDNAILGDGVLKLRHEKKTGRHNDELGGKETPYTSGYLDTYGKWVQRYGYFECRLKPPSAPGLWPAFWLMPDRGVAVGPQWKRQDTGSGGMEFDIWEHLTRWGPHRYNIAHHWDGYQAGHKSNGSSVIYAQPEADGFYTVGLLWLPGLTVYYAGGVEMARWEDPRVSNVPSNLIFTHVTGGWDNSPLDDKQLPSDFVLDYVRIWQRKDLASAVDGRQKP